MSFRWFATIEVGEAIGGRHQVFVLGQVVRSQGHPTREFGHEFGPIPIRQRVEFLDQLLGGLGHEIRFRSAAAASSSTIGETDGPTGTTCGRAA
jgi:hypothetical protein